MLNPNARLCKTLHVAHKQSEHLAKSGDRWTREVPKNVPRTPGCRKRTTAQSFAAAGAGGKQRPLYYLTEVHVQNALPPFIRLAFAGELLIYPRLLPITTTPPPPSRAEAARGNRDSPFTAGASCIVLQQARGGCGRELVFYAESAASPVNRHHMQNRISCPRWELNPRQSTFSRSGCPLKDQSHFSSMDCFVTRNSWSTSGQWISGSCADGFFLKFKSALWKLTHAASALLGEKPIGTLSAKVHHNCCHLHARPAGG